MAEDLVHTDLVKQQFEELVKKAIELTNGRKDRVFIISIPDWSATPFAKENDIKKISKEIDVFNSVNKAISIQYKVQYIEITSDSREAREFPALVGKDKLHPSAIAYSKWAEKIADLFASELK